MHTTGLRVIRMRLIRQQRLPALLGALVLVGAIASCLVSGQASAATVEPVGVKVTIDPGHGGGYPGATYGGVYEKDLNLAIARKVAAELRARGIEAELTRNSDVKIYQGGGIATWRWSDALAAYEYGVFPAGTAEERLRQDLQARVDVANRQGSDLFVSIHNNAGGTTAIGSEVWRAPNDPLGQQFGVDVLQHLTAAAGSRSRGVFSGSFYVLRWSNTPAILVECGFMSNSTERARLRSASYQNQMAKGIAEGILRFTTRTVDERFVRLWGADRFATAAAVAQRGWPQGSDTVVLVSGEVFADSLVAAPLATQYGAPLLTVRSDAVPPATAQEIERLAPERIVVVGGPSAVSQDVVTQALEAAGLSAGDARRIAGADRYETSRAVAEAMSVTTTQSVVVASGTSFPDALSIAASAAERGEPIMLVHPSGFSESARAFVAGRAITVVGGPAVVPDSVVAGMSVERIAGADRYETNWAVLNARYDSTAMLSPVIASATDFPDALVLGPLAAQEHRPVLLIGKTTVTSQLRPWLYSRRDATFSPIIVGGPAAVSAYLDPMFTKWQMRQF